MMLIFPESFQWHAVFLLPEHEFQPLAEQMPVGTGLPKEMLKVQ
jgi:hypothetical protein